MSSGIIIFVQKKNEIKVNKKTQLYGLKVHLVHMLYSTNEPYQKVVVENTQEQKKRQATTINKKLCFNNHPYPFCLRYSPKTRIYLFSVGIWMYDCVISKYVLCCFFLFCCHIEIFSHIFCMCPNKRETILFYSNTPSLSIYIQF